MDLTSISPPSLARQSKSELARSVALKENTRERGHTPSIMQLERQENWSIPEILNNCSEFVGCKRRCHEKIINLRLHRTFTEIENALSTFHRLSIMAYLFDHERHRMGDRSRRSY